MADRRSAGRLGTRAEEGGASAARPAPGPPPPARPPQSPSPMRYARVRGYSRPFTSDPAPGSRADRAPGGGGRGAGSGRRQPMGARRGAGRREAMPMVRARLCHSGPSGARAGGSGTWWLSLLPGRVWGQPNGSTSRRSGCNGSARSSQPEPAASSAGREPRTQRCGAVGNVGALPGWTVALLMLTLTRSVSCPSTAFRLVQANQCN